MGAAQTLSSAQHPGCVCVWEWGAHAMSYTVAIHWGVCVLVPACRHLGSRTGCLLSAWLASSTFAVTPPHPEVPVRSKECGEVRQTTVAGHPPSLARTSTSSWMSKRASMRGVPWYSTLTHCSVVKALPENSCSTQPSSSVPFSFFCRPGQAQQQSESQG